MTDQLGLPHPVITKMSMPSWWVAMCLNCNWRCGGSEEDVRAAADRHEQEA